MDFVVSKVAMSVCALAVAGVLSGTVRTALSPDPDRELDSVLDALEETVGVLATRGCEGAVEWTVPSPPSGRQVTLSFGHGIVLLRADDLYRAACMTPALHTWTYDGGHMNATAIDELDASGGTVSASSGDILTISAATVLVDDAPEVLYFVRCS